VFKHDEEDYLSQEGKVFLHKYGDKHKNLRFCIYYQDQLFLASPFGFFGVVYETKVPVNLHDYEPMHSGTITITVKDDKVARAVVEEN
jgi:hypothetical protein